VITKRTINNPTGPLDNAINAGEHTIQIQGVGEDGFIRSANLGVVVEEPVTSAGFIVPEWSPLVLLATLVLLVISISTVSRRRKKANGSNVILFRRAA
jgi:uncharacterized protein (UPF0548 family)